MNIPYYIQVNYARLMSGRLLRFELKNHSPFAATCRCPICGDSQKSESKARFNFYTRDNELFVHCFNCGYSKGFTRFLKETDTFLYQQLLTDVFRTDKPETVIPKSKKKEVKIIKSASWKDCVVPISRSKEAQAYLRGRKIPEGQWARLFYTKNLNLTYHEICETMGIEAEDKKVARIESIFFPFLDKEGSLVFATARNIDDHGKIRYSTFELQPSYKLFGVESVNEEDAIYVTEGPIDSLFLDNAVATGDAQLDRAAQLFDKSRLVLVPDNEPRAPIQVEKIRKFIECGFSVVLMPDYVEEKDLNAMFKDGGWDPKKLVEENTFQGQRAMLRFSKWQRVDTKRKWFK